MASQVLLSTVGPSDVTIDDFGARTFTHPTVDFDLLDEFSLDEIRNSEDLQAAITAVEVTLKDQDGNNLPSVKEVGGHQHYTADVLDFDTEVGNNTDVAANTAARHDRSHGIGSTSDHTSGTLAQVNALISDATLDDSGDPRDPNAHNTTHQSGGSDSIKLDDLAAPDDNTDLDSTISSHGLLPKLGGGTTDFLRADGTWETPPGDVALTSTAPVDVTKAPASVGVGTTAARTDHKHDVTTAAPGATGVSTASGEGTATTLARSDHSHQANTAPSDVTKAAAVIGTSGEPARADHKHDVTTAVASAQVPGDTAIEGTATSIARSDHKHSLPAFGAASGTFCEGDDARLSDARTPLAHASTHENGGADEISVAGLSGLLADAQTPTAHNTTHQSGGSDAIKLDDLATPDDNTALNSTATEHGLLPKLSGTATDYLDGSGAWSVPPGSPLSDVDPVNVSKSAASEGTATEASRQDHKHDIDTAAPSSIGTANTEGTATSLSRSDHVHNHGAQTTPTHHAVATTSANGFMSSADKTKLDNLPTGASTAIVTWGNNRIATSTTTRYLTPWYDDSVAETVSTEWRVPRSGTMQNLRIRQNTAGVGAATNTYTLMVNGSPTALSVAMSNTVQDGSDLSNTVVVSSGDLLGLRVTKSVSISQSPDNVVASLEVTS